LRKGKIKELEMFRKLAGLTAIAGLFVVGSASAAISGSKHDFTDDIGTGGFTDLCAVCHTPHTADTEVSDAPLWDHELTSTDFTPYPSGAGTTMDSTPDGTMADLGISRLCLSCHDGTVAVDSYGDNIGSGTTFIQASAGPFAGVGAGMLDNDMSSEHPIGMAYADAGSTNGGMRPAPVGNTVLFGTGATATVECASCHDVHNETANTHLLLTTNAGSLICLECHVK
jgi:predicted CXXCH cytochrome family protein